MRRRRLSSFSWSKRPSASRMEKPFAFLHLIRRFECGYSLRGHVPEQNHLGASCLLVAGAPGKSGNLDVISGLFFYFPHGGYDQVLISGLNLPFGRVQSLYLTRKTSNISRSVGVFPARAGPRRPTRITEPSGDSEVMSLFFLFIESISARIVKTSSCVRLSILPSF